MKPYINSFTQLTSILPEPCGSPTDTQSSFSSYGGPHGQHGVDSFAELGSGRRRSAAQPKSQRGLVAGRALNLAQIELSSSPGPCGSYERISVALWSGLPHLVFDLVMDRIGHSTSCFDDRRDPPNIADLAEETQIEGMADTVSTRLA